MKKSFITIVPNINVEKDGVSFLKDKEYTAYITSQNVVLSYGEGLNGMAVQIGGLEGRRPYFKDSSFLSKFKVLDMPINSIETDIYVPQPEKKGYLKYLRQKTVAEVFKELVDFLKQNDLYTRFDYFDISTKEEIFPKWIYLCCYAAPGSNEGYYVHVDVTLSSGERVPMFLGKLLSNMNEALEISNMITKVFYDEL